jgi:hypothetical protein
LTPVWCEFAARVTTLYAAWAVLLLGVALGVLGSLALALPVYVLVERPFSLLLPRGGGGGGGVGGGGGGFK